MTHDNSIVNKNVVEFESKFTYVQFTNIALQSTFEYCKAMARNRYSYSKWTTKTVLYNIESGNWPPVHLISLHQKCMLLSASNTTYPSTLTWVQRRISWQTNFDIAHHLIDSSNTAPIDSWINWHQNFQSVQRISQTNPVSRATENSLMGISWVGKINRMVGW